MIMCIFIANDYYLNIQAWLFFPWPRHELLCNIPDKNQDSVTKDTYNSAGEHKPFQKCRIQFRSWLNMKCQQCLHPLNVRYF